MPLRISLFLLCLPILVGATTVWASEDSLGWMSREEIAKLPEDRRIETPAWCGGAYHSPHLFDIQHHSDTVISADSSRAYQGGAAELTGDVRIEQHGRQITTDRAWFDQDSGAFLLEGGVRAETVRSTLIANSMIGNTESEEVALFGVRYALFDLHAHGNAKSLFQSGDHALINEGSYTTCKPGQRGWRLDANQISIDQEKGWGQARHVVLRVRDIPAAYIPWITFPIDDRRKTGLLFPTFRSKNSHEHDVSVPIYLNLHPQYDATIAPRHINRRGSGMENEFRYLSRLGEGQLSHSWLSKDRLYGNETRQLANWTHDGTIDNWRLRTDVNYVSDDFYFQDMETGLDIRSTTSLSRFAEARYQRRQWTGFVRLQDWQVINPEGGRANRPYRRLPQLELFGSPVHQKFLEVDWFSQLIRFERPESLTTDIEGSRLHLQPAITIPLRNSWGFLEPSARAYHTQYQLNDTEFTENTQPSRSIIGSSVDMGMFLERPFTLRDQSFLQTLEPRIFYHRIPFEDQTDIPVFDTGEAAFSWAALFRENRFTSYDRIGDEEKLSTGITSRILYADSGNELFRFRAGQAHYQQDRKVQRRADTPPETDKRSPFVADLNWSFFDQWQMYIETQRDTEANEVLQNRAYLSYGRDSRRVIHFGYNQRPRDELEQSDVAAAWPIHANWSLMGRWLYDLTQERSIETMAGLEYRDCCWQIRLFGLTELSGRDEDLELEREQTIMLQLRMIGLADVGGRINELLERSIPGYRSK